MGVNKNFVVKNGLEVDTNLILANAESNRVGIGTSLPTHLLHVNGGIAATHISVSGVTTVNTLVIDGGISIGNSFGGVRQYLTGDGAGGITWSRLPELRTSQLYTATESQVDFDYTATVAYIDVYVNGVKLTENSFSYIPGIKVVLNDSAFADDLVEIIGYTTDAVGSSSGGTIGGITIYENNTLKGVAGFITSINFVGPTVGVTTTGYGVTVYSAGGGGGGESYWGQTATGIHTTSNVGIGTTNSPNALTVVGDASISGFTTLGITTIGTSSTETSLYVEGGISATGIVTAFQFVGDGSGITNITASAVDTGWVNTPSVGIGTTVNVGVGTTNPQYQLEVAQFGDIGTQLYVHGGIEATSNISIGGSLTAAGGIGAGSIVIDGSLIDAPALISVGGTAVRILGDLYVDGTRTETSAVDLQVTDKVVGLGTTSTPDDIGADGGGIILYGDTNKEFLWSYSTNSWTSNVDLDLPINKSYKINGEQRLSYGMLTVPNATVSGVVTASTVSAGIVTIANTLFAGNYTGNGNALSGIVTSIVAGSNISISGSTGRVVINATGVGTGGGGGSNVTISDTAPADPFSGDLWYSSVLGRGFIYYVDDDSSQWVDFAPNGGVQSNTITISNNGIPLPQAISNIDFTGNVSISTSIAGIATVNIINYWESSVTGITTTANVGIGTTNATSALTVVGDVRVGVDTSTGVILTSPGGTQYRLIVDDSGNLSTVAV